MVESCCVVVAVLQTELDQTVEILGLLQGLISSARFKECASLYGVGSEFRRFLRMFWIRVLEKQATG